MYRPLADQLRPLTLDDVVGQRHLIGENGILRRIIESGSIPNMIFYGPSGVGKTTLASIIANQTQRKLYKLNATTASLQDIKAIVDELDTFLAPQGGYDVPAHLKDAHYQGAQQLGRGLTYRYPHDYPGHWVPQQYLPDELKGRVYYQPGDNKLEQQAQAYWQKVKGSRQN